MTYSPTWADFYLICFAVGFCFSFFSFVLGGARSGRLHLPHFHGHAGGAHLPSAGVPAAQAPVATGHGPVPGDARAATGGTHGQQSGSVSPFNFATLTAFLAWFGGTGYLLTRFSSIWFALGLMIAMGAGLFGAGIVFLFLTRVLISREENMDAADYEMVGVLGRISMPIRENGTGEIIYSQAGTRRTCGARTENGSAVQKGAEIVVTRYDKGIAYVRLWEEISGEEP